MQPTHTVVALTYAVSVRSIAITIIVTPPFHRSCGGVSAIIIIIMMIIIIHSMSKEAWVGVVKVSLV